MLHSDLGHESPIEHASFTFGIEGVSRSLLAQITRHRIASFSVQSQRYVRENGFELCAAAGDCRRARRPRRSSCQAMEEDARRTMSCLTELLKERTLPGACWPQGMPEKQARARRRSRPSRTPALCCPTPASTKMVVHHERPQLCRTSFPPAAATGPSGRSGSWPTRCFRLVYAGGAPPLCKGGPAPALRGACPEGKMSCGQMAQVREKFQVL